MADTDAQKLAQAQLQEAQHAAETARHAKKTAIAETEATDALKGDERVRLPKNFSIL